MARKNQSVKFWHEPESHSILRLWIALHQSFGAEPHFVIAEGQYAYVLRFSPSEQVTISTVRDVIDATVPFGVGVQLAQRVTADPNPTESPPWFH